MKVRRDILTSTALLGGALVIAMLPATSAAAADSDLPVKAAAPAAPDTGWTSTGIFDAGSNIWIQKPPSGFGKSSAEPFWLTPNTTDSIAKMNEYGKVPSSLFLDVFGFSAMRNDGRFAVDFWADNVGENNQRYSLWLYEPGRQYFNVGWDQTPHLLSTSAKTLFGGVGSTFLTVDPATRAFLQSQSAVATQSQTNRNNIDNFINGRGNFGGAGFPAPMYNIDLQTLRETFAAGYRNTMLEDWDFNVDYSHTHRTGTRPLGIGYGLNATTPNPRPSTGSVEVPQPLDDTTQIANASGEYVGRTPWDTRWNTSVKYTGSFFNNNNKILDVQNPFCITCSAIGPAPFGASLFQYGLYPDNNVNGVTWNVAVDLPFKTRYTSNVQYMMFRQNDSFINDATNGLTVGNGGALTVVAPFPSASQLRPYPAGSLNGEVNAFLTNNVFYTRVNPDLTNTARIRYYDRQDNTPTLTFLNYAYADGGLAITQPLTRDPKSYSRLNFEDEIKWQASRAWTFGIAPFWERYIYENGEVDSTNEPGIKGFVNWTPWSWAVGRASLQYSQRRYNTWLGATSTDVAANAMRQFFVMNRDQTKGTAVFEVQVTKDVTISPNGGVRWNEYPTDAVLNQVNAITNSLGTQYDRSWNVGADLGVRVTPDLRFTFGYNYEQHYLGMQSCCGGATGGFLGSNTWATQITQAYNTFLAAAEWKAIPGKIHFKADYVAAVANEANNTQGCSSGQLQCTGRNFLTDPPVVWPDEHNLFQRFNVMAIYYVDPTVVKQMGWFGEVTLRARYTFEQNRNTNWATDNFSPYSPSPADAGGAATGTDITNGGRSLFLAYNNPNYTAQLVALSLGVKW
jgi:MtrB/PioB family decaheme-associated outer membrane protein